jgi:hypothetical protein
LEFARYESTDSLSDFTGLALVYSNERQPSFRLQHNYIFMSQDQQFDWSEADVIQIQSYFVSALGALLTQPTDNPLRNWNEAYLVFKDFLQTKLLQNSKTCIECEHNQNKCFKFELSDAKANE